MRGIVFGTTLDVARDKLNKISTEYEKFWNVEIERIISSRHEYKMIFSNGDIWQCAEAIGASCCGRRCNIALIDRNISKEIVDCIILPCLVRQPFGAIGYY